MPAVFPIQVNLPYTHELTFINHIETMGDGHEKRINKNLSFGPRADGNGGIASYKGINGFTITLVGLDFTSGDASREANKIWDFYKARSGSFEAFYFYDLNQVASIDLSGTDQTGRYLVRFVDDKLTREALTSRLMKHGLTLIEVRS